MTDAPHDKVTQLFESQARLQTKLSEVEMHNKNLRITKQKQKWKKKARNGVKKIRRGTKS